MLSLSVGMVLASLVVTYAWWVKIRIINLRQDIFDIRDGLFDRALHLQALSDPAYRETRDHLNTVASTVHCLSLMVIFYSLGRGVLASAEGRFKTENAQLQAAIDDALESSSLRVARYLLRETLMGVVCEIMAFPNRLRDVAESQLLRWSRRWVYSQSPDEIAAVGGSRDC